MSETVPQPVVPDLLERRAAADPDGVAFLVDRGGTLTFGEWEQRSRAAANALLASGVGRGARVGLLFGGTDWNDYAVAYFAVLRTGASALHLNERLGSAEILRQLAQCEAAHLIHADRLAAPDGFTGRGLPLSELEKGPDTPLEVRISPEDIADVHYTSGTTGTPKPYAVPHGNLTFGRDPSNYRPFTGGASMLVPMAPASSTAATCVFSALVAPVTSVVCDPHDIERLAWLIQEHAISTLAVTPWIAIQMNGARVSERYDLTSVTMLASAGALLPPPIAVRMLAAMPQATLTSAFSQSEAGPALVVNVFDAARPLSVGRPSPTTELRLVGADGEEAGFGEVGEIWLRHPAPKRLYLDAHRNKAVLADGWHRTGDHGRLGPEGDLVLFDRGPDIIQTEDGQVSSLEVESVLFDHDAIRDVAVVGVPAGGGQHVVAAAVVLEEGTDIATVEAFADARLEPHQIPSRYLVLDALPRNLKGKVLKNSLRESAAATVSAR
jgi:fatty-acyl-CoA synthase